MCAVLQSVLGYAITLAHASCAPPAVVPLVKNHRLSAQVREGACLRTWWASRYCCLVVSHGCDCCSTLSGKSGLALSPCSCGAAVVRQGWPGQWPDTQGLRVHADDAKISHCCQWPRAVSCPALCTHGAQSYALVQNCGWYHTLISGFDLVVGMGVQLPTFVQGASRQLCFHLLHTCARVQKHVIYPHTLHGWIGALFFCGFDGMRVLLLHCCVRSESSGCMLVPADAMAPSGLWHCRCCVCVQKSTTPCYVL